MRVKCKKCGRSYNHWADHKCDPKVVKAEARIKQLHGVPPSGYELGTDFGDICSTCGQRIKPKPLTSAEKQRRYRARKKGN